MVCAWGILWMREDAGSTNSPLLAQGLTIPFRVNLNICLQMFYKTMTGTGTGTARPRFTRVYLNNERIALISIADTEITTQKSLTWKNEWSECRFVCFMFYKSKVKNVVNLCWMWRPLSLNQVRNNLKNRIGGSLKQNSVKLSIATVMMTPDLWPPTPDWVIRAFLQGWRAPHPFLQYHIVNNVSLKLNGWETRWSWQFRITWISRQLKLLSIYIITQLE